MAELTKDETQVLRVGLSQTQDTSNLEKLKSLWRAQGGTSIAEFLRSCADGLLTGTLRRASQTDSRIVAGEPPEQKEVKRKKRK